MGYTNNIAPSSKQYSVGILSNSLRVLFQWRVRTFIPDKTQQTEKSGDRRVSTFNLKGNTGYDWNNGMLIRVIILYETEEKK